MQKVHRLPDVPHASLSASSAERWLECPGSVRLSAGAHEDSKFYNVEGTVAHHIGEQVLSGGSYLDHIGRVYEQSGIKVTVDQAMLDAVQVFVETVRGDLEPGGALYPEANLTPALKAVHPEFGGISDAIVVNPSPLLRVYDYKHGAGIWVPAAGNKQLKYYALGAARAHPEHRFSEVEVVVVQPRCGDTDDVVRRWRFDAFELLAFEAELLDGASAVKEPDAALNPGDWCKFCKGKVRVQADGSMVECPALKSKKELVMSSLLPPLVSPDDITDDQLGEWMAALGPVEQRAKAIREFAYERATRGRPPTGYKIVSKRGSRKYKDAAVARTYLQNEPKAWKPPAEPDLLSPAQLEKALGKTVYREKAADLVHMVSSGYTLVRESDKRPAATDVSPDLLSKLD